ncbi:N-6 DNA methylase [Salinigranum marinum]|uniref:N-6 DNA methylase n=1 Tax=Salinigranum marinum TaxID=1515595 RepID=UPI00298A071D|nr:N-6 DNA methylase [Salinigranum marinum]
MPPGGGTDGIVRLGEELPTRVGDCRVRLRTLPPDHARTGTWFVEFVAGGARTTLVLSDGSDRTEGDPASDARRAAVALDGSYLYGVVTDGTVRVRRIECRSDPGRDRAVCTAVPVGRLRSVLALVAWRVRTDTAVCDAAFDALRRAVEPLARARLDHRLEDPAFADRLRDSLRAAGPAPDEVALGADERAALASQASCLFVDALVAGRDGQPTVADGVTGERSRSAWSALAARVRHRVDDPLFDPAETPLADAALRPPPSAPEPAFAAAVDAVEATLSALDGSALSRSASTLARLFERLVPVDRRWRWGQVYTPTAVARLLADWAVGGDVTATARVTAAAGATAADAKADSGSVDVVLDPACGTGRLLRAAVESCRDRGESPPAVYGRDVFALPAALATRSLPDGVTAEIAAGDFFDCVPAAADAEDRSRRNGSDGPTRDAASDDPTPPDPLPLADAVLVNPPYTRREALDDDYVAFVRRAIASGETVDRTAGLASYFIRHAASFLRDGGRMGVVVGSSWLDADYGAGLKSFLLDTFRIRGVVGAPRHHLVDTADVNAVLLLLERTDDARERDDGLVSFVRLRAPPATFLDGDDVLATLLDGDAAGDAAAGEGDGSADSHGIPDAEVVRRRQSTLRQAAAGDGRARACGGETGQWGRYVRAPRVYWTVAERCGDRLVDFHDLDAAGWARLSYGTRSGAPDFFYLPNPHHDVAVDGDALRVVPRDGTGLSEPRRLPRRYWMHATDDAERGRTDRPDGWRPNYLLKRTTGVDRLRFDVDDLDLGTQLRYVLRFPEARDDLDPAARAYVEWGERHDVTDCPHCRRAKSFPAYCSGKRWYDITGQLTRGSLLPNKDVHATHAYWAPSTPLWVHQSLYGIDAADPPLLAALVNSTLGLFLLELAGRVSLGEGALDLMTGDHRSVPVPDPRTVDVAARDRLVGRFETVASRPIGSVFEECGARRRAHVSLDGVRADRRALDEAVMGDLLGLSAAVQAEVYRGLVGLVDDRLTKAARGR